MAGEDDSTRNIEDIADEIVNAVEGTENDDGLTNGERRIETQKEEERIRKAKELRRQLRKRQLGILKYRWPAAVLVIAGFLSIWTEFLVVMERPPDIGFDTFWDAFLATNNVFFLFPIMAGVLFILTGILAYSDPRATYVSVISGMMMAMSGGMVYFLVSFALTVDPGVDVASTGIPLTMIITGVLSLLAIAMREKE